MATKSSSGTVASQMKTQKLFTKLAEVAKYVNLDVSTILQEKLNGQVLNVLRSRLIAGVSLVLRAPEIRQSKGLFRNCQEISRLLKEEDGQLLCDG